MHRLRIIVALTVVASLVSCGRSRDEAPGPPPNNASTPLFRGSESGPGPAISRPVEEGIADQQGVPSNPSRLPVYDLKIAPKDLIFWERNAFSNQTVPATFTFQDRVYEGVQVRYRGAWARSWPKKPVKIFFDKVKLFEGQRCLNLNSAWHDPAIVREYMAYHVYSMCGSPAPRCRMVRLNVNGQFRGLYVEVEQPDQNFTKERKFHGASVYKAASHANHADERDLGSEAAYRSHYEKQTKKSEGYADLQELCHDLAQAQDVSEFFNRHIDTDKYINYLAATALTQNWDGYNKNHYLVHDKGGSGKWFVVPWDLDRTFGDHWNWSFNETQLSPLLGTRHQPGVTGWNRLQEKFFSNPALRARFLDRLTVLLQDEFTEAKLYPVLDRLEAEITPDALLDRQRWRGSDPDFHRGIGQVKRYVKERRSFLQSEVARLRKG